MTSIDRQTINNLIRDRGQEVTFRRPVSSTGTYDPSSSSVIGGSNDDETVKVVFTNYREREVDGTNVERGDRKVLMSNFRLNGKVLGKLPDSGDQFIGSNSTVNVISAQSLIDGGVIIGFICQVRE
jgi:hypothetical protein